MVMRVSRRDRRRASSVLGLNEVRDDVRALHAQTERYKETALRVIEEVRDSIEYIAGAVERGEAGASPAEIAAWIRKVDFHGRG